MAYGMCIEVSNYSRPVSQIPNIIIIQVKICSSLNSNLANQFISYIIPFKFLYCYFFLFQAEKGNQEINKIFCLFRFWILGKVMCWLQLLIQSFMSVTGIINNFYYIQVLPTLIKNFLPNIYISIDIYSSQQNKCYWL